MKYCLLILACAAAASAVPLHGQAILDRLDEALTFSTAHDSIRARLSGTLDLEGYAFTRPAPGLIDAPGNALFNPRLTLFLDSQIGPKLYLFAQARLDRGFDPADQLPQLRLDEYALRITPWEDGRFNVQIGKFATVVGNFGERHLPWDNPFINAPLLYENVTAASDVDAPLNAAEFSRGGATEKYDHLPLIWGPSYASGLSVAVKAGKFSFAAELKNAALASRPESWDLTSVNLSHPTVSGRIGWQPAPAWNFGFSASDGAYLRAESADSLPQGRGIGDYHEILLGQDASFAWHHLQIWAECYEARFQVPRVGNAGSLAYYLEAKYKFNSGLFGALRWNQQLFRHIDTREGTDVALGDDIWRIDAAVGFRFTAQTQVKLQYSLQNEDSAAGRYGHLVAGQLTVRF